MTASEPPWGSRPTRFASLGAASGLEAKRVIDATDRVVCPGFIDMHAHSGLVMLAEPKHEPKVLQGVTTEVIGVDGNSYAPFRSTRDLDAFIRLNSGLDGDPALDLRWSTVGRRERCAG
jgi:N-acyl-D-amino-acid deacylase